MRKCLALTLGCILILSLLAAFGAEHSQDLASQEKSQAEDSGLTIHKIGVATYNIKDAQVMMFKEYLDKYIKECFPDVTFLYSDSIGSGEDMMNFLQTCADNGAEGIMFFFTNDFRKEVEFCADHGMYVIRPSGNVSDAQFQAVASNPYFIGELGPGAQAEYDAAVEMTKAMATGEGTYVILSGGAFMGNEMHRLRTVGMLDTLQEIAGANFHQSSELLAMVNEPTVAETDGLKVIICPGYAELEIFGAPAKEAIVSGDYSAVLSTIPVAPLMDALNASDVKCGVIDCFSEDNFFGFKKDKVGYVAGKYPSEIGPAFAALYNAITGNAEIYRDNGKAFRLVQGYWTASSFAEYDSMYALACGAAVNAYNYEDLYSVVRNLNPDADFASFKALAEACSYDECLARRAN